MVVTLKPPLYIGDNRMITYLDSGEAVIVDTRSLDALNYIMAMGLEQDVFPLFQRILRHDSVVVDIGANVGFYTLKAASRVASAGKLYSIEGNPHVFELLRTSLYANHYWDHPNIRALNVLVHDQRSELDIRFSVSKGLGGGSIWHEVGADADQQSRRVAALPLDDIIPSDTKVDLVKIDVEGNEPYVLRGMKRIIERSPDIKIIVEYFSDFFKKSYGGPERVQQLITQELGLRMWRIHDLGMLTEVPSDTVLEGNHYCLLARSIDDLEPSGEVINVDPASLSLPANSVPARNGSSLSWNVPQLAAVGADGILAYGPYLNLSPGYYSVRFVGRLTGKLGVRLQGNFGHRVVQEAELQALDAPIQFELDSALQKFEIAMIARSCKEFQLDLVQITKDGAKL